MNINCQKIFDRETGKIERAIKRIFRNKRPSVLYEPADYILKSGGKRLRPFLVVLSSKAAGGDYRDAYNAAIATELLHNFTLVHDDIMDNANKRRNLETLHNKYDLNTAILTGDSLAAISINILLKDAKKNPLEIISAFSKGFIEVCEGQSYDMEFENKEGVTISEYLMMIRKKTAALIEMSCKIGAIIGGGSRQEISALSDFGRNLGMAFQIQDDLLDIAAEEADFGKKIGGDLIEGKKTFLLLKALEIAQGKKLREFQAVIKNKGIKEEEVTKYRLLYEELNIFEMAKKEINRYTKKALKAIKDIQDEEARALLNWLANKLADRIK